MFHAEFTIKLIDMQFRDIKAGYTIFLFDRNEIELKEAKVTDVSTPHYDSHYGGLSEMVVDVSIEGQPNPYTFKERTETGYAGNTVISTSRESILSEVEAILTQSEQALSQRDKLENNVAKCKKILTDFSPKYKKEQENEARFGKIESMMKEQAELLKMQQEMLNKFINGKQ